MIDCGIGGIGAWGPGFESWDALRELLFARDVSRYEQGVATIAPKPESIPARERRRSPLAVKLGVEVATQACAAAGVRPADTPCVFASGMGDTHITDYMCRALCTESKLLSPTKFHNSVHNASAGYWSISTGCHQASSAVSAFELTFPVALLEAAVQCAVEHRPVLLVLHDIKVAKPLEDTLPVADSFAGALILDPTSRAMTLSIVDERDQTPWPELACEALRSLYATNPAARLLALLEQQARGTRALDIPLSPRWKLRVEIDR